MAIYFHIGLPKTATTFWQYSVFRKITDMTVLQYSVSAEAEASLKSLARYLHSEETLDDGPVLKDMEVLLDAQVDRDILVTHENISLNSTGLWNGKGATPERVARFLEALRGRRPDTKFGIIIGTRRVDDWLASRYAESSKSFKKFGQEDFERRMTRLAGKTTLEGPELWLDSARVRALFEARFGTQNVHIAPMEKLRDTPEEAILRMGRFLERDLDYVVAKLKVADRLTDKRNSLSIKESTWQLRSTGEDLYLKAELAMAVRRRFEACT